MDKKMTNDELLDLLNEARIAVSAAAYQGGDDSCDARLLRRMNEALRDFDRRVAERMLLASFGFRY